jgi:hypothetical protein
LLGKCVLHRGDVNTAEDLFSPIKALPIDVSEKKACSLASAKRKAKRQVQSVQDKATSNLVAAARTIFDPDQVSGMRSIGIGGMPHHLHMVNGWKTLKDSESSRRHYINNAQWGVPGSLQGNTQNAHQKTDDLGRAGLTGVLPAKLRKLAQKDLNKAKADPQVMYQNQVAVRFHHYTGALVKWTVVSALEHVFGFPGSLAPLLDPASSQRCMEEFRIDVKCSTLRRIAHDRHCVSSG